ncbi:hypothetical protein Kfla_0734 [Kribbella flavida DSM 17836]|uniref:Uncharacterized protein n=1 Tax=Kribbella flavida (strain DSM 17836 / JCM 10339 / NBRC 14399) TaxID=479435 RepID=D2PYK8_KRIFD|nr:hypothetical protein [Kribbella flavida]ADB29854.1 hypothetical protein Kfla_0734 [Kribbella flavida DSM 17836]
MGYWGYLVAAKSDQPLHELPELSAFGDEYVEVKPLSNGWQQVWVAGANDNPLTGAQSLATVTGHPVLAALILDSDCGPVSAATPPGATWSGTLAKSIAVDSYAMPDDNIPASAAASTFTEWATSAALLADQTLITRALAPTATDPEHLFTLLLQATGIAAVN